MIKFARLAFYTLDKNIKRHSSFTSAMAEAIDEKIVQNQNTKKRKAEQIKPRYNFKRKGWIEYNAEENKNRRDNDETAAPASSNPEERIKRKKCCMLLGYSGANYYGMQRNPAMKTIEEDLLVAMLKNKWITDEAFKQAQTIQFQRAARTDKGVSAARQCVSLKLPDSVDIETLNKDLPEQIKVFSVKRVTKGFNSKDKCDARTYTYTLPTVAFADHTDTVEMETYRVPTDRLNQTNEILKMFLGTKNFHNFTSRKDFLDPSARRYIISFECGEPFVTDKNVEFAVIKVKGQSFMLHQIRKMVGLTLAVVRQVTTAETITRAFTDAQLDLPMAPGLGLVLDQVHYDRYNDRYGTDGMHESLTWTDEEPIVQDFFKVHIVPVIVNTEVTEKPMLSWLETLPMHSFTDRPKNANDANIKSDADDVEE